MICSKEDFDKYVEVRDSGIINMLDIKSGMLLSGLSEIKYRDIIKNFKNYKHSYYGKSNKQSNKR